MEAFRNQHLQKSKGLRKRVLEESEKKIKASLCSPIEVFHIHC